MAELLNSSSSLLKDVNCELKEADLWKKLHLMQHEMLVRKEGRFMFPFLGIKISGLNPFNRYKTGIHIVPADNFTYKCKRNQWIATGQVVQDTSHHTLYQTQFHDASFWNSEIYVNPVKLTNDYSKKDDHIVLDSGRKYMIEVQVQMDANVTCDHLTSSDRRLKIFFKLPLTEFITVTEYHNLEVMKIKAKLNPFSRMSYKEEPDVITRKTLENTGQTN